MHGGGDSTGASGIGTVGATTGDAVVPIQNDGRDMSSFNANISRVEIKNKLTIYYQNVRGLNTKTHELKNSSYYCNFDIIGFTETWLSPQVLNSELFSNEYLVFRSDRRTSLLNIKRGGGVLLAIHNNLSATVIDTDLVSNNFIDVDILGLCVQFKFSKILLFITYIPPKFTQHEDLFASISALPCLNGVFDGIFLGDFNIPDFNSLYDTGNFDGIPKLTSIKNFAEFCNFKQFNNVLNQNARLLDLVFSNMQSLHVFESDSPVLPTDAHHPPLIMQCLACTPREIHFNVKNGYSYNFKKANFQRMYHLLLNSDWNFLNNVSDADEAVSIFYRYLDNLFSMTVPKTFHKQSKYPPWFTREVVTLLKRKESLWRKYKRSKNPNDYDSFRNARTALKNMIDTTYKAYLTNLETKFQNDPQSFWSYVNYQNSSGSLPTTMHYRDQELKDPQNIINAFADLFENSYINSSSYEPNHADINLNSSQFFLTVLTPGDIELACKKLKAKPTSGPDGIPSFIVKDCAAAFAKHLTIIFNLCIRNCLFPDLWKQSKICPIFKKDDRSKVENYRPVALINNFSKVFELVLHAYLSFYVNPKINDQQHGFCPGKSTVTNLCTISQHVSEQLDAGFQVDVVYTDFSKAFDRLDHGILLSKLSCFGFNNNLIKFIQNYLTDRSQYVQYRGYRSNTFVATSGVPQGSVLGPLFFNVFINDITVELTNMCLLYADDLKIVRSIKGLDDCQHLENDIIKLNSWCLKNNLLLNIPKCNVLSFSRSKNPILYDYSINDASLSRVDCFKDLGVIFDPKLTFTHHIDNIIAMSYKSLGFLIRSSREFKSPETINSLFYSLVRSRLEYASVIWQPYYQVHIDKIEKIQSRYLRFLSFKIDGYYPPFTVSRTSLLTRFVFSTLEHRRFYFSLAFLFKLLNNIIICPDLLAKINIYVPPISTREPQTFYLPRNRTNVLKYSPLHFACSLYDRLKNHFDIFNCSCNIIRTVCKNQL